MGQIYTYAYLLPVKINSSGNETRNISSVDPLGNFLGHFSKKNLDLCSSFILSVFSFQKSNVPMKRIAETDSPGAGVSVPPLELW